MSSNNPVRPSFEVFVEQAREYTVVPIWREVLADLETPLSAFAKLVGEREGFLLESVEHAERWGRFSFLGRDPALTFVARGRNLEWIGGAAPPGVPSDQGTLAALEALLARPNAPEHIVIETSGLALPKPLVKAFNWPAIRSRVTVDGVIAVVDGAAVAAGRFADDPEELKRQAESNSALDHDNPLEEVYEDELLCADLIVLNKADLMTADTASRVTTEIQATVPRAVKIVETREGRIDPAILQDLLQPKQ